MEAVSLADDADGVLLEQARSGDEHAFADLVRPHLRRLHAVCYRITGNDSAADDAVQNALVAAWRNLDRFEGRARFSTWLYQIAHNAALAEVRRRPPTFAMGEFDSVAVVRGPEEQVTVQVAVQSALRKIPPDFRAALVLREFAGLSYQQIAEAEGIRIETVKTRISRARQALARLLAED